MTNNLEEHFRIVWLFTILFLVYTHASLVVYFIDENNSNMQSFLREVYFGLLFFIIAHEFIRVQLIRIKLFKEEWWPIVSENGQVIGSIQSLESITSKEPFLHPVIRVFLINDGKIFMQKHSSKDPVSPDMWDTALFNHVRMNETVESCITRTAIENYGVSDVDPLFLSKHIHKSENEHHFVYLFLICKLEIKKVNSYLIDRVKWWTIKQIEENIGSGIFGKNFETEFDILKRSGLLENGSYNCNCALKEVVFQGINKKSVN